MDALEDSHMTMPELQTRTGKSSVFLLHLMNRYGLFKTQAYSEGYAVLLAKLIALSLGAIPQKEIALMLTREKALLRLLKVDTINSAPSWYEDMCVKKPGPTRLLLSGYDLGHGMDERHIQTSLDFASREKELFSGREMGDDVLRALHLCADTQRGIIRKLSQEQKVLANSLAWIRRACKSA